MSVGGCEYLDNLLHAWPYEGGPKHDAGTIIDGGAASEDAGLRDAASDPPQRDAGVDGSTACDAQPEACGDQIDNDCDGRADEGSWYFDQDGDGYAAAFAPSTCAPDSSQRWTTRTPNEGRDCNDSLAGRYYNPGMTMFLNWSFHNVGNGDHNCDSREEPGLDSFPGPLCQAPDQCDCAVSATGAALTCSKTEELVLLHRKRTTERGCVLDMTEEPATGSSPTSYAVQLGCR